MTIIYLVRLSPAASSDLPENRPGRSIVLCLVLLRMGFTWLRLLPAGRQSLTLPFHPYRHKAGGISLLHQPWSHLHQTLSGILPCEARTFLTCIKQPRSSILLTPVRLQLFYYEKVKGDSCKLFRSTFAKPHLTMLTFCSCGYFVASILPHSLTNASIRRLSGMFAPVAV